MAESANLTAPKASQLASSASGSLRSSSTSSAKQASICGSNPEAYLRKLFNGDENKVKAGLTLRKWAKTTLLARRQRSLSAQLSLLQTQHSLILTNPQHFQDIDIESLIDISPLAFGAGSQSADPYRTMTETTDSFLRSELRRYATFSSTLPKNEQSQDFKTQIQAIENGRREILQTYAQRVRLMAPKPPSPPATSKAAVPTQNENLENKITATTLEKKPKLKKRASIRWADGNGQPLYQSQSFDMEAIVAPSKTVSTQ